MSKREVPYYNDYISHNLFTYLKKEGRPVQGVPDLWEVGEGGGLETQEALKFVCDLYEAVKIRLNEVLVQRQIDREFLDQRTRACYELNKNLNIDLLDPKYHTVLGHEDAQGRIVMGPKNTSYCRKGGGKPVATIPKPLAGHHVTLFGPPDDAKLSINAMNAFHRKIKDEPKIIGELLGGSSEFPKWGADDEDSKTPLRKDLVSAGENLTRCFTRDLDFMDSKSGKSYKLESEKLSLPIKRFPGLALPSPFLFYRDNPIPLHIYDFALHLFENWGRPEALSFYVPKLETEEEARYIHFMIKTAEKMVQGRHPEYVLGSIRLFIVLENPRAIFRVNEIMDELHPYFAGASLGWHDYLSSTARLFKEDPNYRIPVKADPDIVIKYIKASHELLAEVVGSRGGIKIGGMYGVLPMDNDLWGDSFQITIKGFIKDVITQMKRDLSGFWVAHPDFVRIGMALVEAWQQYARGQKTGLETLVTALLDKKYHKEILDFIHGPDITGLDLESPLYARSLIVADIKESNFIANNHPDEIRYNVFQSLQYLADWLSGNGCVALPAQIDGVPVRVMDDLATAERSRWEVWHELHHGRFGLKEFLKIAHEEMLFIRKDQSDGKKIVQVKWDGRTEKWYPVAFNLMVQMMTSEKPPEFASELLLPFTVESLRVAKDPWSAIKAIDPDKYSVSTYIEKFNHYFSICGSVSFADAMANQVVLDLSRAESLIKSFDLSEVIEAARFHGDIGESKKTLDEMASREQALVLKEADEVKMQLNQLGTEYLNKFGVKFLISAKDKSGQEILSQLKLRLENSPQLELENARNALWEISLKRLKPTVGLREQIEDLMKKHNIIGTQICISYKGHSQSLHFGERTRGRQPVAADTWFELASLSKTLASCFALEYFRSKNIPLQASVNGLLEKTFSKFRLKSKGESSWADAVTLEHLMSHTALNLHYVNGVPEIEDMPNVREFLNGNSKYDYKPVAVIHEPGSVFQYSGGGFLVLEHLIESLENKTIQTLTQPFFDQLGLKNLSFEQKTLKGHEYATGYLDSGTEVVGGRKMFPAFAAGAMGTAKDTVQFLAALTKAYHHREGAGPISHDTAVRMLHGVNKSSQKFMRANMGLGVFTAEAGPNRLAIHQGANDGFRCLFLYCYEGPDQGSGFTIFCNAELNGVLFISEIAQHILRNLKIEGVDLQKFQKAFDTTQTPPEEIVNRGYKDLIFQAFEGDLPEEILKKGPRDPLATWNLAVGAKILEVSNQRFARAENLLSAHLPVFDPELYGRQGKIMDSWETVRHNPKLCDELIFELKNPSTIHFVAVSTKYHLGNQAQAVEIRGRTSESQEWKFLVPKTELAGHALKKLKSHDTQTMVKQIQVLLYPDGGLTRLGLYSSDLPYEEQQQFSESASVTFRDVIPHSMRPLTPKYEATDYEVKANWKRLKAGSEVDVASSAFGGKILSASNEHYGPAVQIISPFPPLNMFDGFESARSREAGHFEEVEIGLGRFGTVHRIDIDFKYFKNNNPRELSLQGWDGKSWISILDGVGVKAYAGNIFSISLLKELSKIKVIVIPDGGMNRIHVWSIV